MVDALERLLQLTGMPVAVGLVVLGALPAAAGAWVRLQWRGHHDAFHRHRTLAPALGARYGRTTRTRRAVLARLRRDLRFDRGRWLVATVLWLIVVAGWAIASVGLLERVWVRNELERELALLPPGGALVVFGLWSAGLVYAVRLAMDRRAGSDGSHGVPAGVWPAVMRAVPLIFVLSGVAAWLADRVGYPLPVALVAVLLPGTGLLMLCMVQDRRVPVADGPLPGWIFALAPELAPRVDPSATLAATSAAMSAPTVASPVRSVRPRRPPYRAVLGGAVAGGRGVLQRLAERTGPVDAGSTAREQGPRSMTPRLRWAQLSAPPTPLRSRDPARLGAYTVLERIGAGGMAVVFAGRSRSGQRVALKLPTQVSGADDELRKRLAAEMRAMARLDVPGVVRIRDAEDDDGLMYIAMDYLAGPTLDAAVDRLGPIRDPEILRSLAGRLARALAGIHAAGITHRDVKPKNIILTDSGPVLVDLGIARMADATHGLTGAGVVVGSAGYVPPEIHRGRPSAHDVDVWAWAGCVAYAAAGLPLFPGETVSEVVARVLEHHPDPDVLATVTRVDPHLGVVVRQAVHPDRAARPVDGRALWRALPPFGAWPAPWAGRAVPSREHAESTGRH